MVYRKTGFGGIEFKIIVESNDTTTDFNNSGIALAFQWATALAVISALNKHEQA